MSLKNDDDKSPSDDPRLTQSERLRNKKPPPKTGQKNTNVSSVGGGEGGGGSKHDTPVGSQSGSPLMFNGTNKGVSPSGSVGSFKGDFLKGNSPAGSMKGSVLGNKDGSPSGSRSDSPVVIPGPAGGQSPTGSINSRNGESRGMESPLGGSRQLHLLDPSSPGSKSASRPDSRVESRTSSIRPIEHSSSGMGSPKTGSVRGKSTPPSGSSREGSRRRVSENRSESPIFYPTTPHEKESSKGGSLGGSRAGSPVGSLMSFEDPGLQSQSQSQQQPPETWTTASNAASGGSTFVAIQPIVEEDPRLDGTTQEQEFNADDRDDILMVSISQQEVVDTNENDGEGITDRGEGEGFIDEIPPPTGGEEEGRSLSVLKSNKVILKPVKSSPSSATADEHDGQPRWKKRSKLAKLSIKQHFLNSTPSKCTTLVYLLVPYIFLFFLSPWLLTNLDTRTYVLYFLLFLLLLFLFLFLPSLPPLPPLSSLPAQASARGVCLIASPPGK